MRGPSFTRCSVLPSGRFCSFAGIMATAAAIATSARPTQGKVLGFTRAWYQGAHSFAHFSSKNPIFGH
jgi:hypothetical protein